MEFYISILYLEDSIGIYFPLAGPQTNSQSLERSRSRLVEPGPAGDIFEPRYGYHPVTLHGWQYEYTHIIQSDTSY